MPALGIRQPAACAPRADVWFGADPGESPERRLEMIESEAAVLQGFRERDRNGV